MNLLPTINPKRLVCSAVAFVSLLAIQSAFATCEQKTIPLQNLERSGFICRPANASLAAPIVFAFHGRGSSGKDIAEKTHLHEAWPDALVVYLDGLKGNSTPYDLEGKRNGWQVNIGDMDNRDVAFVDSTLEFLRQNYHVDSKAVFAAGQSNGARLVAILWAMRPHVFRGLAFSATQADSLIRSAEPVSVFMSMAINDENVAFDWQRQSATQAAKLFGLRPLEINGPGVFSAKNAHGLELTIFVHQAGHSWPAGQSEIVMAFFKRQLKSNSLLPTRSRK